MTPDLRAIEAALLGEPCDPSNLSPEAASVVLPLVRRVVHEKDALKAEIDMLRRERHAERQRVDERDQEVGRLRAALEEARLTLAAEQGRAEGRRVRGGSPRSRNGERAGCASGVKDGGGDGSFWKTLRAVVPSPPEWPIPPALPCSPPTRPSSSPAAHDASPKPANSRATA